MNGKLTLTLEKSLIEEAKKFSKNSGKSLSQIVGELLIKTLESPGSMNETIEISPIVSELKGVFNITKKTVSKRRTPMNKAQKNPAKSPKTDNNG